MNTGEKEKLRHQSSSYETHWRTTNCKAPVLSKKSPSCVCLNRNRWYLVRKTDETWWDNIIMSVTLTYLLTKIILYLRQLHEIQVIFKCSRKKMQGKVLVPYCLQLDQTAPVERAFTGCFSWICIHRRAGEQCSFTKRPLKDWVIIMAPTAAAAAAAAAAPCAAVAVNSTPFEQKWIMALSQNGSLFTFHPLHSHLH